MKKRSRNLVFSAGVVLIIIGVVLVALQRAGRTDTPEAVAWQLVTNRFWSNSDDPLLAKLLFYRERGVESLTKLLRQHDSSADRLWQSVHPKLPAPIAKRLAKPIPAVQIRQSALRRLEEIGLAAAPAIPELMEALKDSDDNMRGQALAVLANCGPAAAQAVPEIVQALGRVRLQHSAIRAASAIGAEARPASRKLLALCDDYSRRVESSSRIQSVQITIAVNRAAGQPSVPGPVHIRNYMDAVSSLAYVGAPSDAIAIRLGDFLRALSDRRIPPRDLSPASTLVDSLSRLPADAMPPARLIVELLENASKCERDHEAIPGCSITILMLGKTGPPAAMALPALRTVFNRSWSTTTDAIRVDAAEAMLRIDGTLVDELGPGLVELLRFRKAAILLAQHPNVITTHLPDIEAKFAKQGTRVQLNAAFVLWRALGDTNRALPVLAAALRSGNSMYRPVAAEWLCELGQRNADAIQALIECCKHREYSVRLESVHALERLGSAAQTTVPILHELLFDPQRDVRADAGRALLRIAPESVGSRAQQRR